MKRLLFIIFFNSNFVYSGFSQQYIFNNYSINEGLSQSVVNCVFQDSKGYIWFGTQNGLNRFNGETFDVYSYNPADSNSISNNWIYNIAEDKEGNLWVGTKGGLNKYSASKNSFERIDYQTGFEYDITQYFYDIICLKNGNMLINTPPLISFYDTEKDSFTHFNSKLEYDGSVKDVKIPMLEDDEKVWVGSTKGLSLFSFKTKEFSYLPFVDRSGFVVDIVDVSALFKDRQGKIWVGTTAGLFSLNAVLNRFEEAIFKIETGETFSFENICIRTILEDKSGNLNIGTEGRGLFVISSDSQNFVNIQNYTTENSAIGHNIVQSLIVDRSENLWIGTLSGLSKTDLKKKKFNLYRNSNSPNSLNLLGNVIASLYKDEDGIFWVGNWGQGLNKVDRETNQVEHFSTFQSGNHRISNDFIHVIFKDLQSNIWLGTRNGLLNYDKTANKFVPYYEYFKKPGLPKLENMRIYQIIQDRNENYWIGTQNGLLKIDLKNSNTEIFQYELVAEHKISANLVYSVLEDSEGLIWIATVGGIDVYNPNTQKINHFNKEKNRLTDNFAITLCEDRHGKIWIGTSTYINVFDKKDSTFSWFAQEHGVPNNRIFEIVKDRNNDIWVTTGKGLCKFDEKQNRFQTFTLEDGLQSLEFNIRAACVCDDGELLFGGMNGFNAFYPDSISRNLFIPNLVFTSFYTQKGALKEYVNIEEAPEIVLNHNVFSFTIEFAALEFTNPQKNKYAYKMEGVSDEWIEIGNRRFVPFFALQPGEYSFKVRGSNNDGVWNNEPISIDIFVLPPWWRSVYAYFAYLVVIILAIVVFIKQRERKLKYDKKILEQKVQERTLKIEDQNRLIVSKNEELEELNRTKDKFFSIIGHDLGNQFNIILGFLEVLVADFKKLDQVKVEAHLKNINNSAKQAFNLLENLLTWARMQTNRIDYNPVVFDVRAKIAETAIMYEVACAKKNINFGLPKARETYVFADINMFSTVFRNLLVNAIKFTNENGNISIQIKKLDGFCEISVTDNGVGISDEDVRKIFRIDSKHKTLGTQGEKGTGLGLVLCKEFVEKNGGEIQVKSEVGKGSEFNFTLPLPI
jgi:ligand-binding sensor domain-containing protein/signal transduction histidine kinase